jgi:hypothetical protein
MRFCAAVVLSFAIFPLARAQAQTNVVVPPPPPLVAAPSAPVAPVAPVAPTPPDSLPVTPPDSLSALPPDAAVTPPPAGTAQPPISPVAGTGTTPAAPDAVPVIPNTWNPQKTATIGVLDKVDGSTATVNIPVGGQQTIGDLAVSVLACVIRPPDQVPDAAVFLATQPVTPGAATPLYRGWMVRSSPGATEVGDAGETFRVIGCS